MGTLFFLLFVFLITFLVSLASGLGGYLLHLILPFTFFQASILFSGTLLVLILAQILMNISALTAGKDSIEEDEFDDEFYYGDEEKNENNLKSSELSEEFLNFQKNKKNGRNHLCPCGSGKKYKRCCIYARDKNDKEDIPF